jgi:hypothetical protein
MPIPAGVERSTGQENFWFRGLIDLHVHSSGTSAGAVTRMPNTRAGVGKTSTRTCISA